MIARHVLQVFGRFLGKLSGFLKPKLLKPRFGVNRRNARAYDVGFRVKINILKPALHFRLKTRIAQCFRRQNHFARLQMSQDGVIPATSLGQLRGYI